MWMLIVGIATIMSLIWVLAASMENESASEKHRLAKPHKTSVATSRPLAQHGSRKAA